MADNLRVGIIGGGAIVQVAHLPVLRKIKGVDVVAMCDTDLPKARAIASRFGVPNAYDDIEDVLRTDGLDAGLNVLVEKPLAITAQSAQKIIRAVEKQDRLVMVGLNHRYRPDVQIVRSFVQSGELGPVDSVRGSWHVFRPSRSQLGWRQRRELSGGGVMLDLGLSILDLALWLAGTPVPARVSAALDVTREDQGVEQSGSAFVVCENGASVFVDVTWHHVGEGERFGVGLRGGKGTAAINPLKVWKELNGVPVDVSPTGSVGRENPFMASYRAEWAHFQALLAGQATPPNLYEHLMLHKVIDAIYESAARGKDVAIRA
jgi:predicted dehydrogenase